MRNGNRECGMGNGRRERGRCGGRKGERTGEGGKECCAGEVQGAVGVSSKGGRTGGHGVSWWTGGCKGMCERGDGQGEGQGGAG